MKDFNNVIGHEQIKEHLQSAIELNKLGHAYIFNGDALSGKKMLADLLARTLQCDKKGINPCGECQSCIQAESHNQPDIIWVTHEKPNSIGVEDIRKQINGDIVIKPYSSQYKIYIIDEADKMTVQAQNALLKTIEEPPSYGIIILLTKNSSILLPTILSRCVTLNLKPIQDSLMKDYLLREYHLSNERADFCVGFAQGNLGKAINLSISQEFNEIKDDCIHMLKYMNDMEVYEIIESIKHMSKYKLDIYDYLDFMMMWFRDVLLIKATENINLIVYKEEYNSLKAQASKSSYEGIDHILEAIEKAKVRLKANVNFDIAIELLLLTIKEN